MKFTITKIGHSCITYERDGVKIMVDPGDWSPEAVKETGIAAIFITHKHPDHCFPPALETLMKNNPGVVIKTNSDVGGVLTEKGIAWERFEGGDRLEIGGIAVEGIGKLHAKIHPEISDISNTGLMFDDAFFHPGDSHVPPNRAVKVLALPLISPWNTIEHSIEFARAVKPENCFNIHDGLLRPEAARLKGIPKEFLAKNGIEYSVLEDGMSQTFEY